MGAELLTLLVVALVAGAGAGVLAGLLGVGGGIVIVPALYFALEHADLAPGLSMKIAVGTSLATIIFTAMSSSYGHWKKGAVDTALLRRWVPWIILGVLIGGKIGGVLDQRYLVAIFSSIATLVGLQMLIVPQKEVDEGRNAPRWLWASLGIFAGTIAALMGIGGGLICVPALSYMGYNIRRAVGTSSSIGLCIAIPGALVYAASGFGAEGLPPYSIGYVNLIAAAIIIPLTTLFARVGVMLAHKLSPRTLRAVFGTFLVVMGIRMGLDFLI